MVQVDMMSLWLEECLNYVYSAGLTYDKFALLYNVNSNVNISVKTPVGRTDRRIINNVVTQGDVFGPMFCSKQVDTFGQECLIENKSTYLYRGEVEFPPLSMVDDLLCVTECGFPRLIVKSCNLENKNARRCILENIVRISNARY